MPARRLLMRKIREVLRLKHERCSKGSHQDGTIPMRPLRRPVSLGSRSTRSGFSERFGDAVSVEQCRLVSVNRTRVVRGSSGAPEGPDAILQGTLAVSNEETFAEILRNGVGRHRAYGYGMLLLRPPNRPVPER